MRMNMSEIRLCTYVDFYAVFPKKNTKLRQVTYVRMTGENLKKMA